MVADEIRISREQATKLQGHPRCVAVPHAAQSDRWTQAGGCAL
jgi:hypothetical protein